MPAVGFGALDLQSSLQLSGDYSISSLTVKFYLYIIDMEKLQQINTTLSLLSAIYPKTTNVLKVIGLLMVLKRLANLLVSFYKTAIRPRKNFKKRYGLGSWALITGSSEGIGRAIALELAKQGFNIVLSARTENKLLAAKQLIQSKCPEVQIRLLQMDYSVCGRPGYLSQKLMELEDLDISILVNNVGVDVLDHYHNLTEQQITTLVDINCLAASLLTHKLLPQLRKRAKNNIRSAIVNVASLAGQIPLALHNIYSASKAYVDFLSRSLSYEYQSQIDIISLRPSEVSTPMTFHKQTDIMTILPEDCARGLLNDLGYERTTNGHWSHSLQSALYHLVPQWIFNNVFLHVLGPQFMQEREAARLKRS